jgi:hypothetical protein
MMLKISWYDTTKDFDEDRYTFVLFKDQDKDGVIDAIDARRMKLD